MQRDAHAAARKTSWQARNSSNDKDDAEGERSGMEVVPWPKGSFQDMKFPPLSLSAISISPRCSSVCLYLPSRAALGICTAAALYSTRTHPTVQRAALRRSPAARARFYAEASFTQRLRR